MVRRSGRCLNEALENILDTRFKNNTLYTSKYLCDAFCELHEILYNIDIYIPSTVDITASAISVLFLNNINTTITDNLNTIMTQQLFDTIIKLLSLPIFAIIAKYQLKKHQWITSIPKYISNMLLQILLNMPNLSYDNAYHVYDLFMHMKKYKYTIKDHRLSYDTTELYRESRIHTDVHVFLIFFINKEFPLSEEDTMKILQYSRIAEIAIRNIKDVFTITRNTLREMIVKANNCVRFVYDDKMSAAFAYTPDHLEYACTTLDTDLILRIINEKVLPSEQCVDNVLSHVHRMQVGNITLELDKYKGPMVVRPYHADLIVVEIIRRREVAQRILSMFVNHCYYQLTTDDAARISEQGIDISKIIDIRTRNSIIQNNANTE